MCTVKDGESLSSSTAQKLNSSSGSQNHRPGCWAVQDIPFSCLTCLQLRPFRGYWFFFSSFSSFSSSPKADDLNIVFKSLWWDNLRMSLKALISWQGWENLLMASAEKKYWCANPLNDFFHHSSCYSTTTTLNAKHCSSLLWAKPGVLWGLR